LGRPLQGHLIAVKPSHAANCEMARLIGAQMQKPIRAAQTFGPPPVVAAPVPRMGGSSACQRRKAKRRGDGTGEWRWLDGRDAGDADFAASVSVPDDRSRGEDRGEQDFRGEKCVHQ